MNELDRQLDEVVAAEEEAERREEGAEVARSADAAPENPELEAEADPDRRIEEDDESMLDPAAGTRAAGLARIGDILGAPLFFERGPGGQPKQMNFNVAPSFVPILEATVRQVKERVPASFGPLERITTAGMFVQKPGMHGQGRACDWDRLVFANARISPLERDHESPSAVKRRRYWAFAAICRSNSAFVLHGLFDAAHRDHVHQDSQTGVGFGTASSTVKLCQAVLKEIFGEQLVVDGAFGPLTKGALTRATNRLGISNEINNVAVWQQFLRRSARLGFTLDQ